MPDELIQIAIQNKYSDNNFMDLAGNSFTGMVYGAFLIAALVHAPLPSSGHDAGETPAAFATSVLDICM